MAVSVNKESFGQLIDFFGGERDLSHGRIKVLHDGSFIDDPTRIFRAVRFESRFGFAIDHHTEELIKNAIEQSMFEKVEPQRIRDELMLILQEDAPARALGRMSELEELRFIHHDLKLDSDVMRVYGAIDKVLGWYERSPHKRRGVERWLIYLMALFDDLSYNTVSSVCGRFVFRGSDTARVLSYKSHSKSVLKVMASADYIAPSRIYRLLEGLSFEAILLMLANAALLESPARSGRAGSRIKDFLCKYNGTRIHIKGDDLKALGLKPSPKFRVILDKVLYHKLDGKLRTKKEELAFVKKLVKQMETI
jgi:tRNA nucleotidyltransferase (CCA-adding enzyme)